MTTLGFIGAGNIGGQLARLAVENGYDVVVSNSRGPETLIDLVDDLGDRARAGTAEEAARDAGIVVVAVPLRAFGDLPARALAAKTVVDATNYYPQRDGQVAELDDESTTTSELLQAHLPQAHVVKAFNHIVAAELTTAGRPPGSPGRRALVVAGDDAEAKARVAKLIDRFGFDPVDIGPLAEGWRIQRDTPGYVQRRAADELRADVAAARRYRDM